MGVHGRFTSMRGLEVLLRGTGYVPRSTDIPNTITIAAGPSLAALRASFDRYQPYFATLQVQLSAALCGKDEAVMGGKEMRFRFWIDPAGTVAHAEVLGEDGRAQATNMLARHVRGLAIGKAPPAGLPQPVTMIIYPPSIEEAVAGCPAQNSRARLR